VDTVLHPRFVDQSFPVARPDTRTAPATRSGRAAILDGAADRFASASLEQVVGALAGVRDVAAAAGIAPATVNHHFPPGGDRRNTRLALAALGHALLGHDPADERGVVARHAALAVAPRSAEAAALLRAHHEAAVADAAAALEVRLAADARCLVPGLALEDLAELVVALVDGLRDRRRFRPDGADGLAAAVDVLVERCTEAAVAGPGPAT
jgi:hypothetical protein